MQSQSTERSQASTRGSLEVVIGGVVIDTVEMACYYISNAASQL